MPRSSHHAPLALAYHGLANVGRSSPGRGLFVRPSDFERHACALREWGYRLVTFGEQARLAGVGQAQGTASLSFDDGLADNYTTLLSLLERLAVPATLFVVTGWLEGIHPSAPWARMLTVDELRALHASGIEVGGHTVTHPDLTTLSLQDATAELSDCRKTLEELLDAPVTVAAYPYGQANAVTLDACRAAGYDAACLSHGRGSWTVSLGLPREAMNYGGGMLGLSLKRTGLYEPVMRHLPAKAARRLARGVRETVRFASHDRF